MQEKIKCAIYARVSTNRQGESMLNQVSQCMEYIKRLSDDDIYDLENVTVYRDEAKSGYYTSVFDRDEMKRAMSDARKGTFKLLVFKEISRVGRDKQENPAIIGMFEQCEVRVIAINDNYDSEKKDSITFDILSVLAEQESKKISSRVSSGRKQKASRGQWNGEPPFGYRVNPQTKYLEVDEERGKIPKQVFDLYVNHGQGTFKIANYLNKKGLLTKNGKRWSRETINRLIRNEVYIGNVVYGTRRNELKREYDDSGKMTKKKIQRRIPKNDWQVRENCHPAIVDKDTFYKAQKILLGRSHKRAIRRAYHPLTGILFCGKCGQGMVCQKRSYREKEYRYYICKTYHKFGREECDQTNINAQHIEPQVVQTIRNKLINIPAGILEIVADREEELSRLEQDIRKIQIQKERLKKKQGDLFEQRELFTEEVYRQKMSETKIAIEGIEKEISLTHSQMTSINERIMDGSTLQNIVEEVKRIHELELDELRVLLHEIIHQITVKDEHLTIEYNYNFV